MLTKEQLSRIYWLCGSTCAGKTTTSSALAERLGWNVYHVDEWEVAAACGFASLSVDGSISLEETLQRIAGHWKVW